MRPAWAATSFAQFTEGNVSNTTPPIPLGNLFGYDGSTAGNASLGTINGTGFGDPIPANFFFLNLPGLPADLQGLQNATMRMTASTTAQVVTGFGDTVGSQLFDGEGDLESVIQFTRNTPAAEGNGSRTNLLTINFTAQLSGTLGGETASLTADTLTGYSITYTSDFLSFSPNEQGSFNIALTSWQTLSVDQNIAGSGPLSINDATQNFNIATAAGAGSFAGGPSVSIPEPSSCVLAILGLGLLGVLGRRRLSA
ncbi:MAG TPA: PEP-CTERM sorting domain-containing protein [Pirellulales bacterium]|nr:PEP-CTERM sorting domain-containing protein [Pirellulales bacterium]